MGSFDDILSKDPAERIKELEEENSDLCRECKDLQDEAHLKDKRMVRAYDLLRQTRDYINILKNRLSDEEIAEAEQEFDDNLRNGQASATLEEEENG